jgi:hypothetical protein
MPSSRVYLPSDRSPLTSVEDGVRKEKYLEVFCLRPHSLYGYVQIRELGSTYTRTPCYKRKTRSLEAPS